MKKSNIIIFLILYFSINYSIIAAQDSTQSNWQRTTKIGVHISQIAFSNWTKGGNNSLTYSLSGDFGISYIDTNWRIDNILKLAYGQTKIENESFKTNDNEMLLDNVISRKLGWKVNPFFSNSLRTTITEGFSYSDSSKTKTADFFDPGYITQSLGFTYDKNKYFNTRLGLAIQETFARDLTHYTDDPATDKIENFNIATGFENVTEAKFNIDDNMTYEGSLRLFTRFESLDVWDVRWDNEITAKINSWIEVKLVFILVHEISQTRKTQIKEVFQLGFSYDFFKKKEIRDE